jgi:hypothetical protein
VHSAGHQTALTHPLHHHPLLLLLLHCRRLRLLLLACWPCLHLQVACQLRCCGLLCCGLLLGVRLGLSCCHGGWSEVKDHPVTAAAAATSV